MTMQRLTTEVLGSCFTLCIFSCKLFVSVGLSAVKLQHQAVLSIFSPIMFLQIEKMNARELGASVCFCYFLNITALNASPSKTSDLSLSMFLSRLDLISLTSTSQDPADLRVKEGLSNYEDSISVL